MSYKIRQFTVVAALPESLKALRTLANNLWWTWNHPAQHLFSRLSKEPLTSGSKLNPIALVNSLSSSDIKELERDSAFLRELEDTVASFEEYSKSRTWWQENCQSQQNANAEEKIAYFSLEFALHETLPIYSGGLGVLAGDHLKASSDLGLPLVGVGLLYYQGYFSQYLNAEGWQQESYPQIELNKVPIQPVEDANGKELIVVVPILNTEVSVKVWKVEVGTVTLLLLDTNLEENSAVDRAISSRLYGGDMHARIKQELVLGVGGLRALDALNISPSAYHLNEGHSAFLAFEQLRKPLNEKGLSFEEALEGVRSGNHFTTHTPVPAGNDVFPAHLLSPYVQPLAKQIGVEVERLLKLGRVDEGNAAEPFSMTVLALKTSASANGVSQLHGNVSRKLWQSLWPDLPPEESPISAITNGVHLGTFISRDMSELYDRYIGPSWREEKTSQDAWRGVSQIPDEELWRARDRGRATLVSQVRERVKSQLIKRGAGRLELQRTGEILNGEVLTIGFARRFAAYKRACLLLSDMDRLIKIVNDSERPVQFIFAGKAHPADNLGKELIARLVHATHLPELFGRFVFLENYDMGVGRLLSQGVDVWLNNPRRPLEACGTSGMKIAANSGLNMSVLDGWWCESFDGANGWSIGQGEQYEATDHQDLIESRSIYDLLEREIAPLFYDRSKNGVPTEWVKMVKHSIRTIAPYMNAGRMVADYSNQVYKPRSVSHLIDKNSDFETAKKKSRQIARFREHWSKLEVVDVCTDGVQHIAIGEQLPIKVVANLGGLHPEEVSVEVLHGNVDVTQQFQDRNLIRLSEAQPENGNGTSVFSGSLLTDRAGSFGLSVRLVPVIDGRPHSTIPGLIKWYR